MQVRSVFYFVDLLLVILLVYVCFQFRFIHQPLATNELTYLKYVVPKDANQSSSSVYRFEVPTILRTISKKKFISVNLTTDSIENQKRLEFIRCEARRLKYTNDTAQVIKVFIPNNSKYGTFLSLLYIMSEDQHKTYFEYKNWFYIFGETPFKEIEKTQEVHYIEL